MRFMLPGVFFLCLCQSAFGLKALGDNLRCEAQFFEAHLNFPAGDEQKKNEWPVGDGTNKIFSVAPLASYAYFKKIASEVWHLTVLKPVRHQYPFVERYEVTYLEARLTNLGQAVYRFEHKIGHRKSVEFFLDTLEPAGIFIQHAVTHDQFLHLTCSPE